MGELHTDFLPWLTPRAGDARLWWAPSTGEQVIVYSLGGHTETGFVGPSLFCSDNPPPSREAGVLAIQFADKAAITYDSNTGALSAAGIKSATVDAEESITAKSKQVMVQAAVKILLDTPIVECTERLIAQSLSITEGGEMQGNITHTGGSFTSNGVQVDAHKHSGVQTGGGETGGPVK